MGGFASHPLSKKVSFSKLAKTLRETPVSPGFWEKEKEIIKKAVEKSIKEKESIKMSDKKFRTPFNCVD